MRIVVNHITRMTAPRICIAGIDVETLEHVRPTTPPTDLITRQLMREHGGPFRVGAMVELGAVRAVPARPESEDHRFRTTDARHVRDLDGDEFVALLDSVSCTDLDAGFGPGLDRVGWKYAVEVGGGLRSLAVVKARRRPVFEVDDTYGRLQLRYNDAEPPAYLPVTDIRFYEADHRTIRRGIVDDVARRVRSGIDVFLMLGLARAYQAPSDDRKRHWLQLNGLVLADQPVAETP